MTEALAMLAEDLARLQTEGADAFGGISAFCPREYASAMAKHREYECNVTVTQHAILRLEHEGVWPVVGAIKRLMATMFADADGDPVAVFPHTISVRADSDTEAPAQCHRLHRSAYLFAFLASCANVKKAGRAELSNKFFRHRPPHKNQIRIGGERR